MGILKPSTGDALALLVDVAATYRLTRLLVEDEITKPIREKVWEKYDPAETKVGYWLTCPWCVSIWVGTAAVGARYVWPEGWDAAARVLTASAATGMIASRY